MWKTAFWGKGQKSSLPSQNNQRSDCLIQLPRPSEQELFQAQEIRVSASVYYPPWFMKRFLNIQELLAMCFLLNLALLFRMEFK
jgi:hypothetical protein